MIFSKTLESGSIWTPKVPSTEDTLGMILDWALEQGMAISVDDGEDIALKRSTDKTAIIDAMFSVDEETLIFYSQTTRERLGWMFLVHDRENCGTDFINDYSDSEGNQVAALWRKAFDIEEANRAYYEACTPSK